ncbi:MAG: tetratricopeptide repeat protein [Spirochaetia bacterium]|nr:tetratricopeptide repeat protein [Spirochaetia bacterium]
MNNFQHGLRNVFKNENLIKTFLFASLLFLLINKVGDTDAWVHLNIGKLIYDTGGFPEKEMFVYPNFDKNFLDIYPFWLFSFIVYFLYLTGGVFLLVLFKALTAFFAYYFLLKDVKIKNDNIIISVLCIFIAVYLTQNRLVLRPDLIVMFFIAFTIYSMNDYIENKNKAIYFLPLISLLWANSHSSVVLFFFIVSVYIFSALTNKYIFNNENKYFINIDKKNLNFLLLISAISFLTTLINPTHVKIYFYGFNVLSSDWNKDTIIELKPVSGISAYIVAFFGFFFLTTFTLNKNNFLLHRLLLILPFMIMPFVSQRFIFLLGAIGAPIAAKNIAEFLANKNLFTKYNIKTIYKNSILIGFILLFTVLIKLQSLPLLTSALKWGFDFDYALMPKDAVNYLEKNSINGRILNFFHTGQYIIWQRYPKNTVLSDARSGLDPQLSEKIIKLSSPQIAKELSEKYDSEILFLTQKNYYSYSANTAFGKEEVGSFFSDKAWALVYWDDKSLIYLKKGGKLENIIEKDEYKAINPDMTLNTFEKTFSSASQEEKGAIFTDLNRNLNETKSSLSNLFLAAASFQNGDFIKSLEYSDKIKEKIETPLLTLKKFLLRAKTYDKLNNFEKSSYFFEKSLKIQDSLSIKLEFANMLFRSGDCSESVELYEEVIEKSPTSGSLYEIFIEHLNKCGKTEMAAKYQTKMNSILRKNPNQLNISLAKKYFLQGVSEYLKKNYAASLKAYENSLAFNPNNASVFANMGYVYYDMNDKISAFNYYQKALQINAQIPEANYGIAVVLFEQGRYNQAKVFFENYLNLNSTGHYARKSREYLKLIR